LSKIKEKKQPPRVSSKAVADNIGRNPESEHITFCFKYLTNNNKYTFNHFKKDQSRNELKCRKNLDDLLSTLAQSSWLEIGKRDKTTIGGYELLSVKSFSIPAQSLNVQNDEKLLSFRFGPADSYRLVGSKKERSSVLHVIAYDFDFTLYNHGS